MRLTFAISILLSMSGLAATLTNRTTGTMRIGVTQTNGLASLATGLMGWWTFDGPDVFWTNSTTAGVIDRSGNGNTGKITGSQSTNMVSGINGQAYVGNAVNCGSNSTLNDLVLQGNGGMTVAFWEKSSTTCLFVEKGPLAANSGSWSLERAGASFYFEKELAGGSAPDMWITWPYTFVDDYTSNWVHLVFVWNGSTNKSSCDLYRNGYLQFGKANILAGNSAYDSDAGLNFLISSAAGASVRTIDDVRVWNRILTQDEITALYASSPSCIIGNTGVRPSTNLIYADFYLEGEGNLWTNGAALTGAVLTNGVHDTLGATLTVEHGASPANSCYVTNTSLAIYSPVSVGGVIYSNIGGTHGIAFPYTNSTSDVKISLPQQYTNFVAGCWLTLVDTSDSGTQVDRIFVNPNTNAIGYAVFSVTGTEEVEAHGETTDGFVFSATKIPYEPFKTYWGNLARFATNSIATNSTVIVNLYDPMQYDQHAGTLRLVGHAEVSVARDSFNNLEFGYFNDPPSNTNHFAVYGDIIIGVGTNAVLPFGP